VLILDKQTVIVGTMIDQVLCVI